MLNKLSLTLLLFFFSQTTQAQFVRDWLVLGAFEAKTGEASLSYEYLKNEAELQAFGGEEMQGKIWILFHSPAKILDLADPILNLERTEKSVAYAQIFVYSPVPQRARLAVGSDDEIAIWCNRKQIHYNWVERVHNFGDDQIDFELDLGWNRLLFKIVNNAVAWQLSAQLFPETEVHIQAANPFSATVNVKESSRVTRWKSPEKYTPFINSANTPVLRAPFIFFNEGIRSLENISVSLGTHKPILEMEPIAELAGGELMNYPVTLSVNLLDSLVLADVPLKFQFSHQKKSYPVNFPGLPVREIISTVFSSWILEGWDVTRQGNREIYKKNWQVDEFFRGLHLNLQVDFFEKYGSLYINGRRVLDQFYGYSGNYLLTRNARRNQRFNFRVEVPLDSVETGNSRLPFRATVQPDFPGIQVYLTAKEYAKKIFGVTPRYPENAGQEIYQHLRQNSSYGLSRTLGALEDSLKSIPARADSFTLTMLGNAHIDMAWLWRFPETIKTCEETFAAAIGNMKKYPEYKFSHGQAHSYWWIENQNPDLFKEIQKYVKRGQWEIVGGTWVEPDLNLSDGESQIRQYLYGKHYFKEKFRVDVKTGWMPDSFGHPATLPQILKKCGMTSYSFFRPQPDEQLFTWRAPDGSKVLAHRPARWYGSTKVDADLWQGLWQSVEKFGYRDVLRFYGKGDHGGGPNRREIETLLTLSENPAYPKINFGTMETYYNTLIEDQQDSSSQIPELPEISTEQNFVFRGCYTTQARTKWNNRRAECFVPVAESFATVSTLFKNPYPQNLLTETWRNLLFNQFHDILAGSSIGPVYEDAQQAYDRIFENTDNILKESLAVIATNIDTRFKLSDAVPLIVFNSLNWTRSAPLEITIQLLPGMQNIQLYDQKKNVIPVQIIEQNTERLRFIFLAQDVPELGYRTYWLKQVAEPAAPESNQDQLDLENNFLKVEINPATGRIKRLQQKPEKTDFIQGNGCEIQIQSDTPPNMAAWKLGLKGPVTSLRQPDKIEVVERGPVRKVVRVEYSYEKSVFVQKYILYKDLPRLDVQLTINWQERNQMVKVAVPVNLKNPTATFDIPFGAITRPSDGSEVPAQKWIDLSGPNAGVSLLNDCKYGFDVSGSTMRMSVLRGTTSPDSLADLGYHTLSYSIFPHTGTWQEANTELEACNFNYPLGYFFTQIHKGSLPPSSSILKIEPQNVIISALKKAEDNDDWILRIYETHGEACDVQITLPQMAHTVFESDMLEWKKENLAPRGYEIEVPIGAHEIKTLRFAFE